MFCLPLQSLRNIFYLFFQAERTQVELESLHDETDVVQSTTTINYESLSDDLNNLRSYEILKIQSCPSISSAINSMSLIVDKFLHKFSRAKCVVFLIEGDVVEFDEIQYFKFVENFKGVNRTFMFSFESTEDGSSCIYWRMTSDHHIFSLHVKLNEADAAEGVRSFLMASFRQGHSGNKNP